MQPLLLGCLLALAIAGMYPRVAPDDAVEDLLAKAKAALAGGKPEEAIAFADKALRLEPTSAPASLMRGAANASLRRHKDAIADFTNAISRDPRAAEAYNRRGAEHFKLGHISESIADFDKYLELRPERTPEHWQRGISYYYAGRFEDGWKQFKAYEKVSTNDVENAVWHYLCLARVSGAEKARASLLEIGQDKRVPLMEVYALFRGEAKPADVLAAVRQGEPPPRELKERLFYAHLYLGLYYESQGNRKRMLEHMTQAAEDYPTGGYMGDVARVHVELRRRQEKSK
jgi:lipoprotein NlpI